ncbi:MAG: M14 family metallopeptidase, partial [Gemmatimonadota bacterium]|nr:M14 family metallopeptidase [Gemmatimonadota bacterium]
MRPSLRFALPLLLAAASPTAAQRLPFDPAVPLPAVSAYRATVPTPEAVIGHRIGTRHTRPDQLVTYFDSVARVSDRVVFARHGTTYGGRPLVHAIVTSPANHARLEQIRQANLRLSESPGSVADAELAGMPTIVYMGYSVHGNEASGSEAGVLTLYHLAAGEGPAVQAVLDNAVVIIDPSLNPDGRARFVDWVNGNRSRVPTTDPQDREHNEPWPGGRGNHYWFDLNRDWLPAQLDTRGRLELFHRWRPQLHLDFHEMGGDATYFFQPGVPSRNNPNTPQRTFDLTAEVATYHARALDRIGSLYYTRESFDDLYYGKGSTYPDVNGAVGILFEQASSRGLVAETTSGLLPYDFTVRNQFVTSLSSLEAAVAMRPKLLRHQRDFYREAPGVARSAPVKAWVWSLEGDRTRAQALAQMLLRHRIRVHELARPLTQGGATYRPGAAYVVPVDQPQARLIRGMMERVTEFQDSLFYDVSAWTMPLAFGVAHAEVRGNPAPLLGRAVAEAPFDGGRVEGGEAPYAYLLEWGTYFAPRALHRLQAAGVRPLLLPEAFEADVGGERRRFGRGGVLVPLVQRDTAGA